MMSAASDKMDLLAERVLSYIFNGLPVILIRQPWEADVQIVEIPGRCRDAIQPGGQDALQTALELGRSDRRKAMSLSQLLCSMQAALARAEETGRDRTVALLAGQLLAERALHQLRGEVMPPVLKEDGEVQAWMERRSTLNHFRQSAMKRVVGDLNRGVAHELGKRLSDDLAARIARGRLRLRLRVDAGFVLVPEVARDRALCCRLDEDCNPGRPILLARKTLKAMVLQRFEKDSANGEHAWFDRAPVQESPEQNLKGSPLWLFAVAGRVSRAVKKHALFAISDVKMPGGRAQLLARVTPAGNVSLELIQVVQEHVIESRKGHFQYMPPVLVGSAIRIDPATCNISVFRPFVRQPAGGYCRYLHPYVGALSECRPTVWMENGTGNPMLTVPDVHPAVVKEYGELAERRTADAERDICIVGIGDTLHHATADVAEADGGIRPYFSLDVMGPLRRLLTAGRQTLIRGHQNSRESPRVQPEDLFFPLHRPVADIPLYTFDGRPYHRDEHTERTEAFRRWMRSGAPLGESRRHEVQ